MKMMKLKIKLCLFLISILLVNCQHKEDKSQKKHGVDKIPHQTANTHMHKTHFDTLTKNFESPERKEWQKPEDIIALMGDISSKTVNDIGAGTGYFSFLLLEKAKKVIASDVDERFIKYLENRKIKATNPDIREKLEIRQIPYDRPLLQNEEVDIVLMVDVYHHIENRSHYFKKVKSGLKNGGKLMIVDFKKGDIPYGPPDKMKVSPEEVEEELKNAGFEKIEIDNKTLDFQYIIIAQ